MVTENTNALPALLPDRHPQHDLFICDVADAALKDVMQHMEHPFYSLSKKPETRVKRYRNGDNWLEITPSVKGLATIYDKDILIYCISQIMAKVKRGEMVSPRVRINSHELLIFTNRGTSGREYLALLDALDRLEGTRIRTNITTGDEEQIDGFGLIDASSIRRKQGLDGRLLWCEVRLSDWVFNAIRNEEVLTLHRDYFRLRKPLERRIYELARKHCGTQGEWNIALDLLQKKCGSNSTPREFKRLVQNIVRQDAKHGHMPDYSVRLEGEQVVFANRGTMLPKEAPAQQAVLFISPDTRLKAKEIAEGWDINHVYYEWCDWVAAQKLGTPKNPDKAFLGFCRKWQEKRGRPS